MLQKSTKKEPLKIFIILVKLNDLVDPANPIILVNPEPMADGSAREHNIKMKPEHEKEWNQRLKNKWNCHIKQQDIDTFFVTVTTIHPGSHNWIRSYLLKWLGNFLFLSALSSLANPTIAMKECSTYNVNYDDAALPPTKVGQRKAIKVVGPGGKRLRAMAQIVSNNKVRLYH